MRKQQILALLMAGALTVGMSPYAVFATEEGTAATIEAELGDPEAITDVPETPEEEPTEAPAEEEVPTEAPTEAPTEETPTEAPAEEETVPEAEAAPTEIPAGATTVSTLADLQNAINAAVDATETQILISGTIEITDTALNIPANKNIQIFADAADTQIIRGAAYTGDLITVDGQVTFGTSETEGADLTIDGSVEDSSLVTGSLIKVNAGTCELKENVTLAGNITSGNGGAINNESTGTVTLDGAAITGNQAAKGGAIYNGAAATLNVKGSTLVSGNSDSDDAENNIELNGSVLHVTGAMTEDAQLGVNAETPAAGTAVVDVPEGTPDVTLADVLDYFTYDGEGFTIGTDGKLAAVTTPTPTQAAKIQLKKESGTWKNNTTYVYQFSSTVAGTFYTTKVERGAAAPAFNESYKTGKVDVGEKQQHTEKSLDTSKNYDFYVWVKDASGTVSDPLVISPGFALKGVSIEWKSYSSAKVTFSSARAGDYYVKVVKRGTSVTELTSSDKVGTVEADTKQSYTAKDLAADTEYDIYVCVKDSTGDRSNILLFQTDELTRPAAPVTPHTPVTPPVTDSTVTGLENPLEFYPNKFYDFSVTGAGTTNTNPGEGDVEWVPLYWSTSANPTDAQKHTTWKIGAASGIAQEATYNLYVFFQKYVYTGSQWQATDTVESVTYQFKSAAINLTITPTITGGVDGTGSDGTGTDGTTANTTTGATGSSTGTTSTASSVSTADESPIGSLMALAAASLLAGGYVLVRKRKKS